MSSQRYFPPERYMPPDPRQSPRQSSPRYAGDRGNGSSYGAGSQHRATDHQRRFDDPRDRGFAPRGAPPRGPRAATFDTPRGRVSDPAPQSRGRPYVPRGDFRASGHRGGYREGARALEEPSNPYPWDQGVGSGRGARDVGARRESNARSPPSRNFPETRDYGTAQPAAYEASRNRGPQDFAYEGASQRGPGRGYFRNDWAPRGRGRGASHGEDAHRFRTSDHSPAHERRWEQDRPRLPSSSDPRDDASSPPRQQESVSRAEQPAQVFDPFTQDRAAARDSIPIARPSPPIRPVSRAQGEHRDSERNFDRGWRPPLPDVDRQNHGYPQPKIQSRRDSSSFDRNPHGRHAPAHAPMRAPEASSPPQPPPVPAFGSIPRAQIPQGPKTSFQESRFSKAPPTAPTAPRGARMPDGTPTLSVADLNREPPKAPKAARIQATIKSTEQPPVDTSSNERQNLRASQVSPDPPKSSIAQPPSNAPKGPTAGGQSAAQQISSVFPVPSAPRGAPANASQQYPPAPVPTGPKANRMPGPPPPPPPPPPPLVRIPTGPASGPARKPHWQANNGPIGGVMLPAKRDMHGMQISRGSPAASYNTHSGEGLDHDKAESKLKDRHTFRSAHDFRVGPSPSLRSPPKSPAWGDEPPQFEVASSIREPARSSKEPYEDEDETADGNDDLMELDEADFESKEAQFYKDRAKLEEEKVDLSSRRLRGATPINNLAFLSQMSILVLPQPEEPPALSQGDDESEDRMQPSTPEQPAVDEVDTTDKYWAHAPPELDAITDDDVLCLPYLHRDLGIALQERPFYKANAMRLENEKQDVLNLMTSAAVPEEDAVQEGLRHEFRAIYRQWKDSLEALEQIETVENPDGDEPFEQISYPLLDAPPMQLSTGSRRGGAVNGFELERVLQESLQTANKEEDKRKRLQASARFDPSREVCPPALNYESRAARPVFIDTRNKCLDDDARIAYNLEPELDDFNEEEHERMVAAFTQWSKRWGRLALDVGGDRSYKECIKHYYSSKWRGEFKDQRDKRRQRSKPGRMRSSQILGGRPKANALISNLGDSRMDLYEGSEFSMPSMAVTDSGRPRRAAAPSFGAKEAEELPALAPNTGKKGARSALINDAAQERGARKTRGTARERGQRRPKSQALPRDASLSPEKLEMPTSAPQPFASYNTHGSMAPVTTQPMTEAAYMQEETASIEDIRDGLMPGSGLQHEEPMIRSGGQTRRSGMSSYWSVHETDQFVALVRQLGSDWEEIASRIGTKTPVMVKNLFKRKISQNAIPGLEGDLRTADALRSQPHRFSLSGPHDNGQDRSTNRHSALHKPMDGFPELPSDIEGHISPQIPGRNHFHPSEVASSTNPARQTRALDDQGYRLSRPLEGSEVTARQSIEDDAHSRIHRVIDSGVSSGIRRSPMAQHSTAPWTPRTNPTPGYSQPIPFGDGQRHVNQELDRPHDQRFEQDQTSRDQGCGPGKPPSFPHATFETQYLRGLSEHASSIATRDLANAYAFGQNTTIRPPSPRQERTMPLGVQREPRKQSNILSILNADPDEPSSRGQAPRSRTPPHHYSSMPDPARPASHAERRDREGHTRNDVVSSTPTSGEMRPPFAPRPAQAFATGTDWASRLISGEGRSRQLFEYPERSSSADLHNLAGHNFRTRTPLTSLGYGASMRTLPPEPASLMPLSRSVERLQSGMHDERASETQAYMQEHGQSTHQDHRPFFFNAARDRGGQAGQGMSNPPPNPVTRSADDFLLNGSGTYRGRSAQFDRHLSQRQPQQSLQYRRHEPLFESGGNQSNPFMHPESRATSQRHFPEPYRPPSTSFSNHFSSELSSGNGMGFGRIGSAQQQPPNTNQSQDNEQSMSRPA